MKALDPRFGHGPYNTGVEALADARHVYEAGEAGRKAGDVSIAGKILEGLLVGTLREAGVETEMFDRRILGWLSRWDPEIVQVVIGCIERAHIAGRRAVSEETTALRALAIRACACIEPCSPPDAADGVDSCEHGTWPCKQTELAWQLRGLDVDAERNRASAAWRSQFACLGAMDDEAGK